MTQEVKRRESDTAIVTDATECLPRALPVPPVPNRAPRLSPARLRWRTLPPVARVVVEVMLKPEIHDPQGEAIASACHRLGFGQVTGVRQGKRFEVELSEAADEATLARVAELAAELLANPVIEEFSVRPA
jgi:phosphoribosylformylglycinamidine synthase PurS subunit